MRTTQLKLGNEKKEAMLIAGGTNFKIYSTLGYEGWILKIARTTFMIDEKTPEHKIISKYINLKYLPLSEQESIKSNFQILLSKFSSDSKTHAPEPNP